jgi:hypothetical protein
MQRFGGLAYQYKRACSDQGNVFLRLQFVQAAIVPSKRSKEIGAHLMDVY